MSKVSSAVFELRCIEKRRRITRFFVLLCCALPPKGLILRQQGRIEDSLTLFQAATCLNPQSVDNLKQVTWLPTGPKLTQPLKG